MPSVSSRSTHSRSTRRSQTASSIPACTSPMRREAGRHRRHREVLGLDVGELVPRDRCGDGGIRPPSHRVRRGDRAIARVLVVVDEDALSALLLPPRGRHLLRQPPLDLAGEGERSAAHHRELPVRLDPAEDVDPAVPGRLRPARVADLGEHLTDECRDPLAVAERRPRLRVDVDPELVRMLGVAPPRRPRVEVDDGEVRRPDHLCELGHAELVRMSSRRERDARRLDPLGSLLGHALLVDRLPGDAVGEAAQLRRALVQRADDALRHRDVVLGEVPLRLLRLGEEHLVGVRQLDDPLPHLELDERARHHARR